MLLNDCLIFGKFQPSVAYKSVAYKSVAYKSVDYKSVAYISVAYKSVAYKIVAYKTVACIKKRVLARKIHVSAKCHHWIYQHRLLHLLCNLHLF